MLHDALGGSVVEQPFEDTTKLVALAPMTVADVNVTVWSPVLVTVMYCAPVEAPTVVPGNTRDGAEKLTIWEGVSPRPPSPTLCGLPAAVSVNCNDPVRTPAAEGEKSVYT